MGIFYHSFEILMIIIYDSFTSCSKSRCKFVDSSERLIERRAFCCFYNLLIFDIYFSLEKLMREFILKYNNMNTYLIISIVILVVVIALYFI